MKITSVEFVLSAGNAKECPQDPLVEIAVSGRSNVGKSSLLNSLLGRKGLALVSGTPGKTQRLNYFLVNERFHIVDLPGYGYAKAPESVRKQWGRMMQEYLRSRRQLAAVIQLVDCRHDPSPDDREMVAWLRGEDLPFCLVATKVDKLGRGARAAAVRKIASVLEAPASQAVVPYSSHTGDGKAALLSWIGQTLDGARPRPVRLSERE